MSSSVGASSVGRLFSLPSVGARSVGRLFSLPSVGAPSVGTHSRCPLPRFDKEIDPPTLLGELGATEGTQRFTTKWAAGIGGMKLEKARFDSGGAAGHAGGVSVGENAAWLPLFHS